MPIISYYEAAIFSKAAYNGGDDWMPLLSSTWRRSHFEIDASNGLGLSIFQNDMEKKTVIAFRGTKEISNIIDDFRILMGWPVLTEASAIQLYHQYESEYHANLIFVGHSLGGALATLMSLENNIPAIVFDVPGCHRIAKEKAHFNNHREQIHTILGEPNLINTCDKQLGTLRFVHTSLGHSTVSSTIDAIYTLEEHTAIAATIVSPHYIAAATSAAKVAESTLVSYATFDLHCMKHFLEHLRPSDDLPEGKPVEYIRKWCNWLNHLGNPAGIPAALRKKETSRLPVPVADIQNPATTLAVTQASMASYTATNSSISSVSSLNTSSSLFQSSVGQENSHINSSDERGIQFPRVETLVNSRIAHDKQFNQDLWVISIVNYSHSELIGHGILLVEGRQEDGQFFVGKYDIRAKLNDGQQFTAYNLNPTGYISEIIIDESIDQLYYKNRPAIIHSIIEHRSTRQSFIVDRSKAQEMITEIQQDKEKTENAKAGRDQFISYQFLGQHGFVQSVQSLFYENDDGINCADWCRLKLEKSGVDTEALSTFKKSKPAKTAGGLGCCLS